MTDDFRTQFIEAMQEFGMAIERESDVPTIDLEEAEEEEVQAYSLPMVKNENGVLSYVKASIIQMMDILKESVSELIGVVTTENLSDECVTHGKLGKGAVHADNIDSALLGNYYTKENVDDKLQNDYYTKNQSDGKFASQISQEEFNKIFN